MTQIVTTSSGTSNGLFDILGKGFAAISTLNVSRGITVPPGVLSFVTQTEKKTGLPYAQSVSQIPNGLTSWQSSGGSLAQTIRQACGNILIQFVQDVAVGTVRPNVNDSLAYLIAQMLAGTVTGGDHVTAPTITVTTSAGVSNVGDAVLVSTLVRGGDGATNQNALPEVITGSVTSTTSTATPNIALASPTAVSDRLSQDWPGGSGLSASITATDAAASLLTNGDFSDSTYANIPDGWLVAVGVPGTTVLLTAPEQQTVAIGGTPTGGGYILKYTDAGAIVRATAMLAYNASAIAVQAALRLIPGLDQVTVTATGTTPNFTHTVVFEGVGGNPTQLTSISLMTGGSPTITHATTVSGDAKSYRGTSLIIAGNGSEATALYQQLPTLMANAPYWFHCRLRADGSIAAGALEFEIVDGIGGSVLHAAASTTLSTLATGAFTSKSFAFSLTQAQLAGPAYLRIRLSTAMTTACKVYVDEAALTKATELYAGGPFIAAFSGVTPSVYGDSWTITVANDWGGKFQEWFNRIFSMADQRLLLPTSGGGGLIDDSLIS